MSISFYIAKRLSNKSSRALSRLIIRIATGSVALGVATMLLSLGVVRGFKGQIKQKARSFVGDVQVVRYSINPTFDQTTFMLSDGFKKQIHSIGGIENINGYNVMAGLIKANDEVEGVVFKGYSKDADLSRQKAILLDGRLPNFANEKEVMLSQKIADRLRLKVGDSFILYFIQNPPRKRKMKIVGIADLGFDETGASVLVGSLIQINHLAKLPEQMVGGLEIGIENFDSLDVATERMHQLISTDLRAYSIKEWFPDIFEWLKLLDVNAELVIVLMLAVALINMVSVLLILILEHTHTVGILKALGADNWIVQKIFMISAAKIIGIGLLLGNLLGISVGLLQSNFHFITLDASAYYMSFVPIIFNIWDILWLNIGTFVVCLLVMLLPSLLVSSIRPMRVISFK